MEKSSVAHASDYIVLRGNPGLTSCEHFAMTLSKARLLTSVECYRKKRSKRNSRKYENKRKRQKRNSEKKLKGKRGKERKIQKSKASRQSKNFRKLMFQKH